jgi:hypothetical protein
MKARETLDPAIMLVEPLGKALSASLKRSTGATQHSHVPLDHHSRKACNRPRACTAVPVAAWKPIFRTVPPSVEMWRSVDNSEKVSLKQLRVLVRLTKEELK